MSFGFIIPTCVRSEIHFNQLKRCVSSIQNFHKDKKIILIDDSNENYSDNIKDYYQSNSNILVKKSLKKGSADQQVFKVLLNTKLFEKAILMQDSMILNKKLEGIEDIDLKFIWHFTNHRVHWDLIQEPKTEYNIKNNINSHTDLIYHNVSRDYKDNESFQKYIFYKLKNKNEWCGCFGSLCILSKKKLELINNRVNFIDKFINSINNRDRRVNESIFSLICHYSMPNYNFEESYDGLYYDGFKYGGKSELVNKPTNFDNLKWCSVHNYFSKISFNR